MTIRRAGRYGAAGLCALALAGAVYEQVGRWRDSRRLPQVGRSVDIGGRSLNIYCSGAGSPAVIFESPGAGPGLVNEPIRTEVAKFTKACWYDRAGEGWSDPGPFPRTSAAIADDLHTLMGRAGVAPPYVLVGASFGGLNARVYAARYPRDLAGLVLVDSAHEDEPRRAPKFYLAPSPPRWLWFPMNVGFRTAARIGLVRLFSRRIRADTIEDLRSRPEVVASSALTGIVMPESYEQARSITRLGGLPMVVLTAGKPMALGDPDLDRQAAAYQHIWVTEMQAGLARLSTAGRQVVIENADHGSIPDSVVLAAVRDVIGRAEARPAGSR